MIRRIIFYIFISLLGGILGYLSYIKFYPRIYENEKSATPILIKPKREVIGFLPYWLLREADIDYSEYLTTLNYFSLSIGKDGSIQRFTNTRWCPQAAGPDKPSRRCYGRAVT